MKRGEELGAKRARELRTLIAAQRKDARSDVQPPLGYQGFRDLCSQCGSEPGADCRAGKCWR